MRPFHVKICGVTRVEDAVAAAELGADFVGLNFYAPSPRHLEAAQAAKIVRALPKGVEAVGVFVNETPETVNRIAEEAGLHLAQLHGSETPEQADRVRIPVIKALRIESEKDIDAAELYKVDLFLIDTPSEGWGGSGKTGDWRLAAEACRRLRAFLAGGLGPDNVTEAVRAVNPYGVDVCSGIERAPGVKDRTKMAVFLERAREAAKAVREKEKR
jgi:phosphoribosylanthranilate isomerase